MAQSHNYLDERLLELDIYPVVGYHEVVTWHSNFFQTIWSASDLWIRIEHDIIEDVLDRG